jgi:palmitoyltransferase ZDHHC9/14/18
MVAQPTASELKHSDGDASFPIPHIAASDAGAPSIISSRMTDIASEDGHGEYPPETPNRPPPSRRNRYSVHTAAESGSRPDTGRSALSPHRNAWSRTSPSRQGYNTGGMSRQGSLHGSTSGNSIGPPGTASRTHVPSLTSQAFFHPMSSQRLQAQRGQRPVSIQAGSEDGILESGDGTVRHSVISDPAAMAGPSIVEDHEMPVPPSRGTEITEHGTFDRVTANTSPTGYHPPNMTLGAPQPTHEESDSKTKNLTLNLDTDHKRTESAPAPPKSPRSFRSSFLRASRGDAVPSPNRNTMGREKLPSVASSLGPTASVHADSHSHEGKGGRNYHYFTGNTFFWFGGRFQNAREKPINFFTGLLVAVPGALFFAFSAPWLWHNVSPAIPIIFAYLFYICMSSFIHASVTDPGVSLLSLSFMISRLNSTDPSPQSSPHASSTNGSRSFDSCPSN